MHARALSLLLLGVVTAGCSSNGGGGDRGNSSDPRDLDALSLERGLPSYGAGGIEPKSEYILDQFLISTEAYARAGFASDESFDAAYGAEPEFEQLEGWETDREMASRLAWKPYMYDASLAGLLAGVPTPALIVRGDSDHVVPGECAELYRAALPNARLEVVAGGHAVDLEQPEKLGTLIKQFLLP